MMNHQTSNKDISTEDIEKDTKLLRSMGHLDEDLIEAATNIGTGKQAGQNEHKLYYFHKNKGLKVAVIAAALTVAMAGSAFAYTQVRNNHMYQTKMANMSSDAFEGSHSYASVNETVKEGNLAVTLEGYYADEHGIYMNLSAQTLDQTEIYEMNENRVPEMGSDTFDNLDITINGEKVNIKNVMDDKGKSSNYVHMSRTDDGSVPSKAGIMIAYVDETRTFDNNDDVQVTFSDYSTRYTSYDDIGMQFDNIGQIFENVTVGDESAFKVNTDEYGQTREYLLPGQMHIAFSSEYPNAYIDNAGFVNHYYADKNGGAPIGQSMFKMTIVPGSEETAEALKNLRFINKITGSALGDAMVETLEDGRIQLAYGVHYDRYYNDDNTEGAYTFGHSSNAPTTMDHLAILTCKVVAGDRKLEVAYPGNWNFKFKLDQADFCSIHSDKETVVLDERTANNSEAYFGVNEINLSGARLNLSLYGGNSYGENAIVKAEKEYPVVNLKDGTMIKTKPTGGQYGKDHKDSDGYTGSMVVTLNTLASAKDIASITWHGVTIYTAE